jgi:hypothetical protein
MKTMFLGLILACLVLLGAQEGTGAGGNGQPGYASGAVQKFTDSFPYSSGDCATTAAGNWTYNTGGVFICGGGGLHVNQSATFGMMRWSGAGGTAATNQYSTMTFTSVGPPYQIIGPSVRVDTGGASNAYSLSCDNAGCQMLKFVTGTQTSLTSISGSIPVSGDAIEIDASGTTTTTLTFYLTHSGVKTLIQTCTDGSGGTCTGAGTALTTGTWGVGGYNDAGGTVASNVTGGNL